jgi:signal transduction histidine kinase
MAREHTLTPGRIIRLSTYLWGLSLVLIIALTVAVAIVYLSDGVLKAQDAGTVFWKRQEYTLTVFLLGLAVIFCCYAAFKRRQLADLSRKLFSEEQELAETKSRLSEILSLFKTTTALNVQLPPESLLDILVQRVVKAMRAQQASVMLYEPGTELLVTRAASGDGSARALTVACRLEEHIGRAAIADRTAVILEGGEELSRFFGCDHIASALIIPLYHESRCIGVMNVHRIGGYPPFRDYHCELGEIFGDHVAKAIAGSEMVNLLDSCANQLESDLATVTWQLGDLDRMKDVFLSTASHELRTPLTALIGNLAMLETHGNTEHRHRLLAEARSACGHLAKLVGDIVNVAKVESGTFCLSRIPTDFNELVRGVLAATAPAAVENAVRFEEDYDPGVPDVYLDPAVTNGVLAHLLEAAIRFSPAGGVIEVRTAHEPGTVSLEIRDHGCTLPDGHASGIFSLFGHNLRDSEQSLSGLGLGLYLVKRVVELHGGRVTAGSGQEAGIVFTLHFPVRVGRNRAGSAHAA